MSLAEAQERHKTMGRNDACSCGSGKKYKKCHQPDDDLLINAELRRLVDEAKAAAAAAAEAEAEESKKDGESKGKSTSRAKQKGGPAPGGKVGPSSAGRSTRGAKAQSLPRRGAV
jgi:hypothetical protein